MLLLVAYVFQYGLYILCGLMVAWSVARLWKRPFTKSLPFRSFPILFFVIVLAHEAYSPIAITSPSDHAVIHPGDRVQLKVELNPPVLSKLFPVVSLTIYRCATCADWPPGVWTEGTLAGSPYTFSVHVPRNQP